MSFVRLTFLAIVCLFALSTCDKTKPPPENQPKEEAPAQPAKSPEKDTKQIAPRPEGQDSQAPTTSKEETPPTPAVRPEVKRMLETAGGDYLATILFHPQRWPNARASFKPMFDSIALVAPSLKAISEAKDATSVLREILKGQGIENLPQSFPNWDQSRPVIAALFKSKLELSSPEHLMHLWHHFEEIQEGVSVRLLVPATNAPGLAKTATALLDPHFSNKKGANIFPVLQYGALYLTASGCIAVRALDDMVAIDIQMAQPARPMDEQAQVETLNKWLQHPASPLEMTPALHHAATANGLAAAHFDMGLLRPLSIYHELAIASDAMLRLISRDHRLPFKALVLSRLARAWGMIRPDTQPIQDFAVSLVVNQGLAVHTVATMTPESRVAMEKAWSNRGKKLPATAGQEEAWLEYNLNVADLISAAPPLLPELGNLNSAKARQELLATIGDIPIGCGPACILHFFTGAWTSLASSMPLDPATAPLPRAVRLTLHSLTAGPKDRPFVTMAVQVDKTVDTTPVRSLLAQLDATGLTKSQLAVRSIEDTTWLTIGFDGNVRSAYGDSLEDRPADSFLRLHVPATTLANGVASLSAELAALFDKLGECTFTLHLDGPAITGTLRLPTLEATPPPTPPSYANYAWSRKAGVASDPAACAAMLMLSKGLDILWQTGLNPLEMLDALIARLEDRKEAATILPYVMGYGAAVAAHRLNLGKRDELRLKACQAGLKSACAKAGEGALMPSVDLPSLSSGCSPLEVPRQHLDFIINPSGLWVDGIFVPAAQPQTLIDVVTAAIGKAGKDTKVFVLVDKDTPFSLFNRFYLTAQNHGVETVHALFNTAPNFMGSIALRLPPDFKMDTQASIQVGSLNIRIDQAGSDDIGLLEFDPQEGRSFPERVRAHWGGSPPGTIEIGALPDTPWKSIARTLDALMCGNEDQPVPSLYLEAPPQEATMEIRRSTVIKERQVLRVLGTSNSEASDLLRIETVTDRVRPSEPRQ